MSSTESKQEAFMRLLSIMDELRTKCPWDMKQTMHTLRNLTIEETYELADAITANDMKEEEVETVETEVVRKDRKVVEEITAIHKPRIFKLNGSRKILIPIFIL